ncbi:hypothetical protein [Dictyobacter aurantiacus]|uniref:Uncharacterized protein n=1 Tax=Dictyobacter aurantiacus TaxID=1936993 RepID=A0A401ZGE5_9CHLR|nr:hypothetical protein [Dictyobacter aurantiacus]GCE05919.1 hypothetical protein KDAU_32480 [Dictyobacter aurantiacus]
MNDPNTVSDNNAPQSGFGRTLLSKRPEHHGKNGVGAFLFILCGCLLLLGGVGALIWQLNSPLEANTSTAASTAPASSAQSGKQPQGCTGAREPVNVIQQQMAANLHLNVAQVQARVLAGKTIAQIATEQGLTAAQLHNVEIQALHTANSRWLSMGCITPQDVQENLKRDTGSTTFMDTEFTDWFKH